MQSKELSAFTGILAEEAEGYHQLRGTHRQSGYAGDRQEIIRMMLEIRPDPQTGSTHSYGRDIPALRDVPPYLHPRPSAEHPLKSTKYGVLPPNAQIARAMSNT